MIAKRTAIYPGSFDPVTTGHMDIIERASLLYDTLIVAVSVNTSKKPVFTSGERVGMLADTCAQIGLSNVEVVAFEGLVTDLAVAKRAAYIVKGLRSLSDYEAEIEMAYVNAVLKPEVQTVFIPAAQDLLHVSSRLVREIARFGGDVRAYVPQPAYDIVASKIIF